MYIYSYTGRHGLLWNSLAVPPTRESSGPTDYLIGYGLTNIRSIGFSFDQFYVQATSDLFLNLTIYNANNWGMTLRFSVNGNTLINTYVVSWIAVDTSVDLLEVRYSCHMCGALNSGTGDRSENTTAQTFLPINKRLKVVAYLSTFFLRNRQGSMMFLSVEAALRIGTNTIDIKFSTKEYNTVSQVCYTILTYSEQMA